MLRIRSEIVEDGGGSEQIRKNEQKYTRNCVKFVQLRLLKKLTSAENWDKLKSIIYL